MQPLNAIDAIAPAFTRTHETLFHPFRFGRSWKLCASSYLAFCGSFFIPFPLFFFILPPGTSASLGSARPIFLLFAIIMTAITLVILYFGSRMELVVFEMLVTRQKFIAPMWRRYSSRVWPWIGLKLLVGIVFSALLIAIFYIPLSHLSATLPLVPMGAHPDPAQLQQFLQAMIGFELAIFFLFFLLKIPSTLLNDFVLPFFVLEPITLTAAIRRGFHAFAADPLQFLFYLVLKPILAVIGFIIHYIAMLICMIPFFIVIFVGALIAGLAFGHGGSSSGIGLLVLAAAIVFYLFFIACSVYFSIGTFGYLLTLLEAYGIYFLAGRYPVLASLLEPGPGAPFTPPPVFPSPEETKDDDDGPPMPLDPAIA